MTSLLAGLLLAAFLPPAPVERESYEVYLCPLHRDEQATGPDRCPVCDREMVLRVLAPGFSCPMHPQIEGEEEGGCPLCGMKLVPTTRELQWYCPENPEILSSAAGSCPDGSAMEMRSLPMAHGDHNPKHGGILFMAPNGYHHLEGTLDGESVFRLHLYDDFTRPIQVGGFEAWIGDLALAASRDGSHFLAKIAGSEVEPVEIALLVRFPGEEKEARFDFIFSRSAEAGAEIAFPEFRIPEAADEIFAEILRRNERVLELIRRGAWPDLYIPALEAKDLVLALKEKEGQRLALPAKKLVRAAWLLDLHGDMGNRIEVESAYRLFEEAISELEESRAR